jgi:glycosyltransferase involved in cell wall biosynthesis
MAPIEALAVGTPTIAYREGGVTETIIDGKSGVLFDEQTSESIVDAIDRAESSEFDAESMREAAQIYSVENFDKKFLDYVDKVMRGNN